MIMITIVGMFMLVTTIVRRYIWRWARKDCLSHDAFHCSKFSKTKPFPTKRILQPNNFVGAVGLSYSSSRHDMSTALSYHRQNHSVTMF